MIKIINEDRMLKLIHNFFENPQTLIIELVQNAVRSKAKNITISTDNGRLSAVDDGNGCDLIAPLLTLAESNWDEEVEQNQQPAGWGLFVLYCLTKEVEITSKFGTLKFDAELYLHNADYRSDVLSLAETDTKPLNEIDTIVTPKGWLSHSTQGLSPIYLHTSKKADGFQISATLKTDSRTDEKLEERITRIDKEQLQFFPINISINGKNIERATVEEIGKDYVIKTSYMGNEVFIGTKDGFFPRSTSGFTVIWYGMQIPPKDILYNHATINVTQGLPLTPVLPFRTSIKEDEKYVHFWDFVRQEIVDYCIGQINNNTTDDQLSLSLMRTMGDIATQNELDGLNRFYVIKTQPYHRGNPFWDTDGESIIITRSEAVISNDIDVRLVESGKRKTLKQRSFSKTKKYVGDYEEIFLPDGAIVQYKTRNKSPEWLKIQEHIHKVEIHISKNAKKYHGNLNWCKAKIVTDLELDIIGMENGYGLDDITIYYSKAAGDVWGLQYPIAHHLYSDEGDTFDSQEAWIESQTMEDIRNIIDYYSKHDLLGGFRAVSKMEVDDIRKITIAEKKMSITLKSGKKKVLSLV